MSKFQIWCSIKKTIPVFICNLKKLSNLVMKKHIWILQITFTCLNHSTPLPSPDCKLLESPLKKWKFSQVDKEGQNKWDLYTQYKDQMFAHTHTTTSPWIIIKTNHKKLVTVIKNNGLNLKIGKILVTVIKTPIWEMKIGEIPVTVIKNTLGSAEKPILPLYQDRENPYR